MDFKTRKKLVHLDLKGAPPRIGFLLELIHLFADLGATGLLMEYEDMFPYAGELEVLRSKTQEPYSREDIVSIQKCASTRGLEIIPLVQTFGHLEFVLKHEIFRGLREVDYCLGTLSPLHEHADGLVQEMLRQIIELHPKSSSLHIGADEVYMLGLGQESEQWLSATGGSVHQLFLNHIIKVAKGIGNISPNLRLIMWDDMLRSMSPELIKESGLVGLVQPMLWDYSPDLDVETTVGLMEKYKSAGMSEQWMASSFKGSTSVHTCVTSTLRHVKNHLQWLKVASGLSAGIELQGIALTGWQRYDHLSVLCELIPVGLPSLASCLQTLLHGSFTEESQKMVVEKFGAVDVGDIERFSSRTYSTFAGAKLAELIVKLMLTLEPAEHFQSNVFVRGWFTPYHRKNKMINPLIAQQLKTQANMILHSAENLVCDLKLEMSLLYSDHTVQEWLDQHVAPVLDHLNNVLRDVDIVLKEMGLYV